MNAADKEILMHFFAGYFHQDWGIDDPDWQAVVRRYFQDGGHMQTSHTAQLIRALIAENKSEAELYSLIFTELGGYYYPPGTGQTYQAWLEVLADELVNQVE